MASFKKAVKISQKHLLGIQDLSINDINIILNEAKDFISILPEEILNDNKIKVLSSKIEVAEKSFEASKNFDHLEQALKDNPKDIKAHINLSNAFFGIGKISECYQLLIEAIKIDPKWNDQEARKKLISFINSHDLNSEEAKKARRQLSSILFN